MQLVINEGLLLIIVLGMSITTGDNRVRDLFAHVVVWLGCFFIALQLGNLLVPGITTRSWSYVGLVIISAVVSGVACYFLVEMAVRIHWWINR